MNRIFTELPAGCEVKELPSLEEELGGGRVALLKELLGAEDGVRAAREAGLYELSDSLAQRLRLQGVRLGEGGELACLSPARWREGAAQPLPASLEGVLLDAADAREFQSYLRLTGNRSAIAPLPMAELARHYFFSRRLRVLVRST